GPCCTETSMAWWRSRTAAATMSRRPPLVSPNPRARCSSCSSGSRSTSRPSSGASLIDPAITDAGPATVRAMTFGAFEDELAYQQVWETVCERVRGSILSGELAAGAKLVEADLARSFGVSRGPIREALRELAREGLVVDLPRRGTFVCTLTQTD